MIEVPSSSKGWDFLGGSGLLGVKVREEFWMWEGNWGTSGCIGSEVVMQLSEWITFSGNRMWREREG